MAEVGNDGKETTADILVRRLLDWGVSVVFGLPGDGINGIMEALRERRERIRFVQVSYSVITRTTAASSSTQ